MTQVKAERYAGSTEIQALLSDGGTGYATFKHWTTFGGASPKIAVAGYDMSLFYTTGTYGLGDGNYGQLYGSVYAIFDDNTSKLLYDEFSYGYAQGHSQRYNTGPHYVANYLTVDEQQRLKELQIVGYANVCWTEKDTTHTGDNGVVCGITLYGRKIPWVAE